MPYVIRSNSSTPTRKLRIYRSVMSALACGVLLFASAGSAVAKQDMQAFPGAVGFGKFANGWRGGAIVSVTSLADHGPGSLRACAEEFIGPKICVFEVSGTIEVDRPIKVASNTYIAGQTAPGQGVQLKLGKSLSTPLVVENANNVLIRFLKVRPGPSLQPSPSVDGVMIYNGHDVYLDHLSIQFATDENLNVYVKNVPTGNITVANSIIALGLDRANHPKGRHSKGALICSDEGPDAECGRISLIGNLFAHNRDRNPDVRGTDKGPIEIMNNVFYNPISQFGEFYNLVGNTKINYVGNVTLPGPNTKKKDRITSVEAFMRDENNSFSIFATDNTNIIRNKCRESRMNPILNETAEMQRVDAPLEPVAYEAYPGSETLERVLSGAGSRVPGGRMDDTLDMKVVRDVRECTGKVVSAASKAGGWPDLISETATPDSDNDGMPDSWETANGLNPADPKDAWTDNNNNGWSNIEDYLSGLAGDPSDE
ncbi:MAG: hypothetical protein ABJN26_04580 [Stappiaceae bacterium]